MDRIEEGTYGVVYKAKDKRTGRYLRTHRVLVTSSSCIACCFKPNGLASSVLVAD